MSLKYIDKELEKYIIDLRRHFHMHPELSWQEEKTSDRILEELTSMGIKAKKVAKTGVIGIINPDKEGPVLAMRADIDALPVKEETGLEFESKNEGVMHACGHDTHAAMLLGAAKAMSKIKDKIGKVVLVFQPAEEFIKDGGAKHMIESGFLEDEKVDRMIAIHIWADIESGKAALQPGPVMASSDTFHIHITGKGGHGAQPQFAIDPIPVGVNIVNNFQQIISRYISPVDPAVLSVTAFNSGSSENVIPETALLMGTVRAFKHETRDGIKEQMEKIIAGVCEANRAQYKFDYFYGSAPTINDDDTVALGRDIMAGIIGEENVVTQDPQMGSEDFSYYLEKVPGSMMFLGAKIEEKYKPHHNPKFFVDENAFKYGAEYFVQYAVAFGEV